MINFKGKHFLKPIILMAVRWYLAYALSYRNIAELLQERGLGVDHSTLNRWVIEYSPQLLAKFKARKKIVTKSWRMMEWRDNEELSKKQPESYESSEYLDWFKKVRHKIFRHHKEAIDLIQNYSSSIYAKGQLDTSQIYKELWLVLNKSLIKETIDVDSTDLKALYRIPAREFVNIYVNDEFTHFFEIYKYNSEKIFDLFSLEIDIMFDPKFVNHIALYRGTMNGYLGDVEIYRLFGDNNSLSFGNGLCEGLLQDTGACALKHMLRTTSNTHLVENGATGYVVFVNISNFLDNKLERTLYWIPPLTSITRVFDQGELFHARILGRNGLRNGAGGLYSAIQTIRNNRYLDENSLVSWQMYVAMMSQNVSNILIPHLIAHSINLVPHMDNKGYKKITLTFPNNSTNCTIDEDKPALEWTYYQMLREQRLANAVDNCISINNFKDELEVMKKIASQKMSV